MDFSDSSTFSTASGKDYHYVVLQVTLKEKFLGTGSGNLTDYYIERRQQGSDGRRPHSGNHGIRKSYLIKQKPLFRAVFCYLSANWNQNFGPISVFSAPQAYPCRSNTVFAIDSPNPSPFALRDGSA